MSHQGFRHWPARYELLDGLRGLACLGVLLHHLGVTTLGHYSVMMFFVISGYCITASAQSCIRQGVPFSGFMMRRVRRIYPPYLLALLFFAATRVAKMTLTDSNLWHPSLLDWVQNLTLTQWMSIPFHPIAWPSDNPKLFVAAFWSLNYEEQFYLVTGLALILAQRFKIDLSRTVLVLFVGGVAWNLSWPGGWVTGFFIEYWAHFAFGSGVYFLLCEYTTARTRYLLFSVAGVLAAYSLSQLVPWHENSEQQYRALIELALLSAFAILLVLLRPLSFHVSRSVMWKPIAALGTISYSLYLVHQFNLSLVETVVNWVTFSATQFWPLAIAKVIVHICIASAFWYACERPFLGRRALEAADVTLSPARQAAVTRS